ncbi:hypothetical protein VTH06DRAFT_303 [Thermothelomyces fergusii]
MHASQKDQFRVVIVGGGVAGLTLANALEQAGVDFVLLERRGEIAPNVGASIGVFPNGARILDQLGAWKAIDQLSAKLKTFYNCNHRGDYITEPDDVASQLVKAKTGYMVAWGERQNLLRILYANLKDQSRVLVNKSLVDIKHESDSVTAICEDGSSFSGHLLVGCDGVFSKTRAKMWQLAEPDHPDLVHADKHCLTAEYNCLFGISYGISKLQPGDFISSYNSGRFGMAIAGDGGKVYWFAQERLPRMYHTHEIPRYTEDDAWDFVARHSDLVFVKGPDGLTLRDFWEKRSSFSLVALEEGKFKLWHWGRIVCVGDSIHKSNPNLGVGANAAIESAAALANGIKRLADQCRAGGGSLPTNGDVEAVLAQYHKTRFVRAEAGVDSSAFLARSHNMQGLGRRLFVHFILPHTTEFITELMGSAMIGAVKLDYLPLPMASLTGMTPFNPTQGDGLRESRLKRALFALPLLALAFVASWVMNPEAAGPWAAALRDSGVFKLPSGDAVPILRSFYRLPAFDDFIALVNTFFFPSVYGTDPLSRRQVLSFLTDGTVLLTIWIFESTRRANFVTPMQWPHLYAAIGQVLGIGVVCPVYCFLHYVLSPIENFAALDQRLTSVRTSLSALPVVLLSYLLPFYAMLAWSDLVTRQVLLYLWQLYPLWAAAALFVGPRLFLRDTMTVDKVSHPLRDLPVMRRYVGAAAALSAVVWWRTMLGPGGLVAVFAPAGLPRSEHDLAHFTAEFLKWDEVFAFGSHLLWLAYLFWDLRGAGMLREGWLRVAGLGLLSLVLFGPGATLGLGWLFREHILATRRHKHALTPESVWRLHGSVFE